MGSWNGPSNGDVSRRSLCSPILGCLKGPSLSCMLPEEGQLGPPSPFLDFPRNCPCPQTVIPLKS